MKDDFIQLKANEISVTYVYDETSEIEVTQAIQEAYRYFLKQETGSL